MKNAAVLPLYLLLLLCATKSHAESLTHEAFELKAGPIGYLDRHEVYSAWNPNNQALVLKPGMKVMFFGRAMGCDIQAANGPVRNSGSIRFEQAYDLTGIPLAPPGKGQRWVPSGDTEQCEESVREQVGDSFVHVNEDSVNGGIGMFTFTGLGQGGRRTFFQQFDKTGRSGKGANANIEGTFVAFRFDWQKNVSVFPWASGASSLEQRVAEFKTTQSVESVSVGDALLGQSAEPIQAKQQFIVAFINLECFRSSGAVKRLCQVQYLFNVAVFRLGIVNWETVKWFRDAGIFADPAQGGMPVVHGPLGQNGAASVDDSSRLELYTSRGESSHHDTFKDKSFIVHVSFAQFKNALRAITARQLKQPISSITTADLVSIFSESWDDPNQWAVLSVNVSQEVHNPVDGQRAYIGGAVREISIRGIN